MNEDEVRRLEDKLIEWKETAHVAFRDKQEAIGMKNFLYDENAHLRQLLRSAAEYVSPESELQKEIKRALEENL